jgi:hypothetical protein
MPHHHWLDPALYRMLIPPAMAGLTSFQVMEV